MGAAISFVNSIIHRHDLMHHNGAKSIPDIFNPPVETLTEDLELVAKTQANEWGVSEDRVGETVVEFYHKTHLSKLFALFGSVSAVPKKDRIFSTIAERYLDEANFEPDPLYQYMRALALQNGMRPPVLPALRQHFYSQIFQDVYIKASPEEKQKIINQLAPFRTQIETVSLRFQRDIESLNRVFFRMANNPVFKIGVCVCLGVVSYFSLQKLVELMGKFFRSDFFTARSAAVVSRLPASVLQTSHEVYGKGVEAVDYVAETTVHKTLFDDPLMRFFVPKTLPPLQPVYFIYSLIRWPVSTIAGQIGLYFYRLAYSPVARAQNAIAMSVKDEPNADYFLIEGMKAYQVWMHVMEAGPDQRLFS